MIAASLLLAGCANIHDDRTRTKVEGTAAGAAAGGVLGGVIGGLVSLGSPSSIAQGALIGAQIGGGAGYAYGTSVANKKAEYASREAWLDACIAEARTTADKSRDYSRLARQVLARQQHELAAVLHNGQILPESQAQAAALRKHMDESISNLGAAVATWDSVLDAHRRVVQHYGQEPQAVSLGRNVNELKQSQDNLRQDLDSFTTLRKSLGQ